MAVNDFLDSVSCKSPIRLSYQDVYDNSSVHITAVRLSMGQLQY